MKTRAEANLYQALSSAIAHAVEGHELEDFSMSIPIEELSKGKHKDVMLKVSVSLQWTSFEEEYEDDIEEELS